ncbi:hypothetical protein D6825_04115 [Candidatus Woesearchaeota archaeon]|nr:MAG: hypothetical protein D6825_04115 [Candidatus Woesearchaeota archaeon]
MRERQVRGKITIEQVAERIRKSSKRFFEHIAWQFPKEERQFTYSTEAWTPEMIKANAHSLPDEADIKSNYLIIKSESERDGANKLSELERLSCKFATNISVHMKTPYFSKTGLAKMVQATVYDTKLIEGIARGIRADPEKAGEKGTSRFLVRAYDCLNFRYRTRDWSWQYDWWLEAIAKGLSKLPN